MRSSALMSSERIRRRVSESLLAKIEDQLGKRGSLSLESGNDLGTNDGNENGETSIIEEEPIGQEYSTPDETGVESSKIAESDDDVLTSSQERVGSGSESTTGGVSAFGRRPSLLALAGRISEVSSKLGRAPEVRRRSIAPDSMRWDRRGSSRVVTVDHDYLTSRIKQAMNVGYGIGRLQELLGGAKEALKERGWRKLRGFDFELLQWFSARERGCYRLRCALLVVVKSRLSAAMTRLQLLTGHGNGVEQIPKLHHLFSAMYESEMAVGVARLHALLERALHRHLRAAVTALSANWHGYRSYNSPSTAVMTVPTPPAGSALLQASAERSTPLLDRSFLQRLLVALTERERDLKLRIGMRGV